MISINFFCTVSDSKLEGSIMKIIEYHKKKLALKVNKYADGA